MNTEQKDFLESHEEIISTSLYAEALKQKEIIKEVRPDEQRYKMQILNLLCITAGIYALDERYDCPIPRDRFMYLYGQSLDPSSPKFQQNRDVFTKYDNEDPLTTTDLISKTLSERDNSKDATALTILVACKILEGIHSEKEKDTWLMYLMVGTEIENNSIDPKGIKYCSKLWAVCANYLNFEERLARITNELAGEIIVPVPVESHSDQKESVSKQSGDTNKYSPPRVENTQASTSRGGGCYVATCVYGSYDCPQVWTLRRYRDYRLSEKWYGCVFIKLYYLISPTLVKRFGGHYWFKKLFKTKLDKMVTKLQDRGFESTPYEDKQY